VGKVLSDEGLELVNSFGCEVNISWNIDHHPHIARNACNNSKPNDNHQWLAQLPQRNGKLNAIPLADRGCPTYKAISERPSDPFQINGVNLTSKEIFTAEMRKSEPNQQYRQQSDP